MGEGYSHIGREELKGKIDHRVKFTLIEVSPRGAFEEVRLPLSINIPPEDIGVLVPRFVPSDWEDLVVYASSPGGASEQAARELVALGYKNVKEYTGGKQDWIDAGYPVESGRPHKEVA